MSAPAIEDRRPRLGRLAGFALLLSAVSWGLGAFAAHPWAASPPDTAVIRISFKHVAAFEHEGEGLSKEEIEKLPRHMRPTSPDRGRTGRRVETVLTVALDGRPILERRYSPSGLRHDGPTFAYEEATVRPGRHQLEVTLADQGGAPGGSAQPRRWRLVEEITIAGEQVVLIELSEDAGLVRHAPAPM